MAGYQIYIPRKQGADPRLLRDVGLGDILDANQGVDASPVDGGGPDGGAGVLFYFGNERPGIRLASQRWVAAKPSGELSAGRFWLGCEISDPPKPSDMQRPTHYGGAMVTLDDGNDWMIPIAQRLPHRLSMDDNGQPVRVPKRAYESFYDAAAGFYRAIMAWGGADGESVTFTDAWPFAVQALSMNYRVNADVIDFLELLDDSNVLTLICATFEMGVMATIEAQKKTA